MNKKVNYIKSIPSQLIDIADSQISKNNAPSIFDVDEFSIEQISSNQTNSTNKTTLPTQFQTASQVQEISSPQLNSDDLAIHNRDPNAHSDLLSLFLSLSDNLQTQTNTGNDSISEISGTLTLITGTYLKSSNILAGSNIGIAQGFDINNYPTAQVYFNPISGVISGTFYSGTVFNYSTGQLYTSGKKVFSQIVNVAGSGAPLTSSAVANNGSNLEFNIYPLGIGLASGTFELHWQMI